MNHNLKTANINPGHDAVHLCNGLASSMNDCLDHDGACPESSGYDRMISVLMPAIAGLESGLTYECDPAEISPDGRYEQLADCLDMTIGQQIAVKAIMFSSVKKRRRLIEYLWARQQANRYTVRIGMEAIDLETETALVTVLSKEQMTQYHVWEKQQG
ncbi:MAG: hypothetical protein KJ950_16265 [Proteobacteria bacterium]|nr:hypothetical protein [Pseudomonadota bacterium]MBU1685886.1 hypothetical protein [Pseudomonadota bacterium]